MLFFPRVCKHSNNFSSFLLSLIGIFVNVTTLFVDWGWRRRLIFGRISHHPFGPFGEKRNLPRFTSVAENKKCHRSNCIYYIGATTPFFKLHSMTKRRDSCLSTKAAAQTRSNIAQKLQLKPSIKGLLCVSR